MVLGYLCLEELQAKQALGQYFVYRYKVGTAVFTEAGEPLPSPHHSWFKIATGHGSIQLRGTPDEILRAPDGGLIIIDYKTAHFKPEDSLRPLYEVQLNVYARIAENLAPRSGYPSPAACRRWG